MVTFKINQKWVIVLKETVFNVTNDRPKRKIKTLILYPFNTWKVNTMYTKNMLKINFVYQFSRRQMASSYPTHHHLAHVFWIRLPRSTDSGPSTNWYLSSPNCASGWHTCRRRYILVQRICPAGSWERYCIEHIHISARYMKYSKIWRPKRRIRAYVHGDSNAWSTRLTRVYINTEYKCKNSAFF